MVEQNETAITEKPIEEQLAIHERRLDDLDAKHVAQEHRIGQVITNWLKRNEMGAGGSLNHRAAWTAFLRLIFFSQTTAIGLASIGGVFSLAFLIFGAAQVQKQITLTEEQYERARRTELIKILYETRPNPAHREWMDRKGKEDSPQASSLYTSDEPLSTIATHTSRTRTEALAEFLLMERNRIRKNTDEQLSADTEETFGIEQIVNLVGARLEYVDGSALINTDFTKVSLRGAVLRGATLSGLDFTNADLSFADLKQARLRQTNFRGATLHWTDLSNLYLVLDGADFSGANLDDACLNVDFRLTASIASASFDTFNGSDSCWPAGTSEFQLKYRVCGNLMHAPGFDSAKGRVVEFCSKHCTVTSDTVMSCASSIKEAKLPPRSWPGP